MYHSPTTYRGHSLGIGTNNFGRALQTDDELPVGGKDVRQPSLRVSLCLTFLLGLVGIHRRCG